MFDNLALIAILISLLWLAAYAVYLIISRRQQDIAQDVEELRRRLERREPSQRT